MASFQTKNPNWVNLGRSWFKDAGIFYGHLFFLQPVGIVYAHLI
jgi:hypothetical protein